MQKKIFGLIKKLKLGTASARNRILEKSFRWCICREPAVPGRRQKSKIAEQAKCAAHDRASARVAEQKQVARSPDRYSVFEHATRRSSRVLKTRRRADH